MTHRPNRVRKIAADSPSIARKVTERHRRAAHERLREEMVQAFLNVQPPKRKGKR